MSRLASFDRFVDAAAKGIQQPHLPPIADTIRSRCGGELPEAYWKLALATKAYVHEANGVDREIAYTGQCLLVAYGGWAFDWAVRRHAVEIRKTSDVKRVADAAGSSTELEGASKWRIADFLIHGRGAANDAAPLHDSFAKICGGIAAVFGPDALMAICRELLDAQFEKVSVASDDYKTALQEETQRRFRAQPTYSEISSSGPDHAREFRWRVVVGPYSADGSGASKKAAQQAAARALLTRIGVKVSGPTTRVSETFEVRDDVSGPVVVSIRAAERSLAYRFRHKGLLATALTHSSYVHENRRKLPDRSFSYEPLASLGSSAVWLLGAEDYLERTANGEQLPADLSEILGVAVKMDLIADLPVSRQLASLLVTGKGQSQSITVRMRSEVMQAVLAAIILDAGEWHRGVSAGAVIAEPFRALLRGFRYEDLESLNPKTTLQEYAQALKWQLAYALECQEGPAHATKFRSQVAVTIVGRRFVFTGARTTSRVASENEAAKTALDYIRAVSKLAGPSAQQNFSAPLIELARAILKSTFDTLRLGAAGWRRVIAADPLRISVLVSQEPADARATLQRIHRLADLTNLRSDLESFELALSLAPLRRPDVGRVIVNFAERWRDVLTESEPDRLEEELLRCAVSEAQLLLGVYSRYADETQDRIDLGAGLRGIGLEVVEPDGPVIINIRAADAISAAVRFAAASVHSLVAVRLTNGSIECSIGLSHMQQARVSAASDVLRSVGIQCIQSDAHVLFSIPSTNADDWATTAMTKLHRGLQSDLPIKYIAHHIHDMKNEIIATLINSATARNDRVHRFKHLAAAEECLERARATCSEVMRAAQQVSTIQISQFQLRAFLTEIVREAMVHAPSIAFTTYLDAADVLFEADRSLLRNAIDNLLRNAVMAVEHGGDIRVESVFDRTSKSVIVEVSNSGALATDDVLNALASGALPPSTAHSGGGFGLVSVERVALLHGGNFRLFNRNGRTHALLELPSATAESSSEGEIGDAATVIVG